MSKTKKIISWVLVVVLLLGVGFGAYFLFGGKKNKLTDKRAISLMSEANKELESSIKTICKGFAGNTASGALSSGSLNANATAGLNGSVLITDEDYSNITFMFGRSNGYLEMINYGLNLGNDNVLQFDKTYSFYESGEANYVTVRHTSDKVVYEFTLKGDYDDGRYSESDVASTYGVIDYNSKKDKVSAFTYFLVQGTTNIDTEEDVTDYDLQIQMVTFDFELKMFNCYEFYMYSFENYNTVKDLRDKLSKGTLKYDDIKGYIDFEDGNDFYVYIGSIASNLDEMKLASHKEEYSRKQIFDSYRSNIKNLDVIASDNSKLDYDNAINYTAGNDLMAVFSAGMDKYCSHYGNGFIFMSLLDQMSSPDWKTYDGKIISMLKEDLGNMSLSNADGTLYNNRIKIELKESTDTYFNLVKETVNALEEYYNRHKDDKSYVPLLQGLCSQDMSLVSSNSRVYSWIGFESAENSFAVNIYVMPLASAGHSDKSTVTLLFGTVK